MMRTERGHWLAVFCAVSFVIHLILLYRTGRFDLNFNTPKPAHNEIEIALLPPAPERPGPKLAAAPKPKAPTPMRVARRTDAIPAPKRTVRERPVRVKAPKPEAQPKREVIARTDPKPSEPAPRKLAGAASPSARSLPKREVIANGASLRGEKPGAIGKIGGRRDSGAPKIARLDRSDPLPGGGGSPSPSALAGGRNGAPSPDSPPDDLAFTGGGAGGVNLPREIANAGGGGRSILSVENPLATEASANEHPGTGPGVGRASSKISLATLRAVPGAGIGAGTGNRVGTHPPSGGTDLSAELPGTGGSGGGWGKGVGRGNGRARIVLANAVAMDNPLAMDVMPHDRPGIGPGTGGGLGSHNGLNGLRSFSRNGTGGGGRVSGRGIAGNGRGTGIDMPGDGGLGTGYGPGNGTGGGGRLRIASAGGMGDNPLAGIGGMGERPGIGAGNGIGPGGGVGGNGNLASLRNGPGGGLGNGGRGAGGTGPGTGRGSHSGPGVEQPGPGGNGIGFGGLGNGTGAGIKIVTHEGPSRNIPDKDVAAMIRVPMRGAPFGARPSPSRSGDGTVHIVYLLDCSDSMNEDSKMARAKHALRNAVGELLPYDSFNIVEFDSHVRTLSSGMINATKSNIRKGEDYIDDIHTDNGTNISAALDFALNMEKATHIYVISDGDPTMGVRDNTRLRQMVKDRNNGRVQILTVALGTGTKPKGMALLKGLAEDNGGSLTYVDLKKHGK